MPLYLTASHSSRIRKPSSGTPPLRRASSSQFSTLLRRKPGRRISSLDKNDGDLLIGDEEKLSDSGKVLSLATISPVHNVVEAIKHSHEVIFSDIPDRAGMNSTQIAEVLNFRKGLPRIVSMAHIHGLIIASTRTERELAKLVGQGELRKLMVSGRGNEVSGLAEFLVLTPDMELQVRDSPLDHSIADKFVELLRKYPRSTSLDARLFSADEITALRGGGFLVSAGISRKASAANTTGSRLAPSAISRQASGTVAAAGGDAAFDSLGGMGSARHAASEAVTAPPGTELILSVPNMGMYLRLLNDARTRLVALLEKSKFNEAPLYLLRERWDGAIDADNKVSNAKRIRGEYAGVLPGKTKKWKQLYGLNVDWVLEECLGAGLVELFETGSVGHGVRVV